MKVKIKKLHEDALIPTYAHETDAGMDFYTLEDESVESLTTKIIRTGIAMDIPDGHSLELYPRSGLSGNHPNYLSNSVGIVDSHYIGEVLVLFRNNSFNQTLNIPKHTKIMQGVLRKFYKAEFEEVEEFKDSERGTDGFGSTGDS